MIQSSNIHSVTVIVDLCLGSQDFASSFKVYGLLCVQTYGGTQCSELGLSLNCTDSRLPSYSQISERILYGGGSQFFYPGLGPCCHVFSVECQTSF